MSYTYLLEQGEESSAESFLDIPQCVLSRLNLIAGKSCCKGSGTESCQSSQFGIMSPPSMELRGGEKSMSSAEDSRAKTSQALARGPESQANEAGFGQKWPESLAKYDPNTHSWRTPQCLLFEDSTECLETFPRWGSMLNGELWERTMSQLRTAETESGLWPTPCASEARQGYQNRNNGKKGTQESLSTKVMDAEKFATPQSRDWRSPAGKLDRWNNPDRSRNLNDQIGGQLNPNWVEWLMGWPIGWTDLNPLEMDKFQQWQHLHGEFLEVEND